MAPALRALNPAKAIAYAGLGGPIAAGLALTLALAFGYLPALGGAAFSFDPWRRLFAEPGIWADIALTMRVGLGAAALSLGLCFVLLAATASRRRRFAFALAPLLAAPHSAVAIGFAFLIAPSGWLMRLVSPWATGFATPPDWATVNDAGGLSLTLGLALKETPFLLAAALAALPRVDEAAQLAVARSLGHAPAAAWLKIVAPQVYRRIRLPVYAALAYSLSVVDMAAVLAPSHPRPLALLGLSWFLAPDLALVFPGAAAATLQGLLVMVGLGLWRLGELAFGEATRRSAEAGRRGRGVAVLVSALSLLTRGALALGLGALLALAVWSFAWRWPFPLALPESWSLEIWAREAPSLTAPFLDTVTLALASSLGALALAVAWLEAEDRLGRRADMRAVFIPLLAPQLTFLFGVQTLFAYLRIDGSFAAVAWAHLLFVFPYVLLALADPWRGLDPRYARAASSLGVGRGRVLWAVKLPLLSRSLALGFSVGVSVSVAQYLSTLFAGGGRIATLTTEAISRAGGGDRRVAAVAAFAQAAIPLFVFALAFLAPRFAAQTRSERA